MRVQNDTKVQTAASSTGTGTAATTGTVSFKELYTSRVQELWDDYKSTGLTAADQELKANTSEDILEYKHKQIKEKRDSKKSARASTATTTETIHKYMPDGSIMVITTKNGKVTEQYRKKPTMVEVPDPIQPASEDGQDPTGTRVKMKLVPHRSPLDD